MPPKKSSKPGMDPAIIAWSVYGAVGFQLAATVVGGLLVGLWLDKKFNLSPWLTVVGMFVGSVGGFYNMIRVLIWHQGKKESKAQKESKDPSFEDTGDGQ